MVHGSKQFKRSSPSPTKTFDEVRGASPEINSYNNIKQNLPTDKEFPRLSVLQNFKEISRIMTSTFLKNKQLEKKYQSRLPHDMRAKQDQENAVTSQMTGIMKRMHSPRSFLSDIKKVG